LPNAPQTSPLPALFLSSKAVVACAEFPFKLPFRLQICTIETNHQGFSLVNYRDSSPLFCPAFLQDIRKMLSYLEQLNRLAKRNRTQLAAAAKKAGVADSQLSRWRRGIGSPRLDTANRIETEIVKLGEKNARVSVHVSRSRLAKAHARLPRSAHRNRA
jgi:transposase-like protein